MQAPNTQANELFATDSSAMSLHQTILAQTIEDPDVLGQMQTAFNNFVESGQVWALLIGLIFGYMFRSFTAY